MLVSKIINSAMRKIGAIASGEELNPKEQQDGLDALQSMLRSWAAEKINVFASVDEEFTLISGTNLYYWGIDLVSVPVPDYQINTARPNQVLGASILSGEVTHPVDIIGEDRYRRITVKSVSGRPTHLFPKFEFPYVQVILYPTPDSTYTLKLDSMKPFTEESSFDSWDSELQMPVSYEEPIIYNLSVRLAPEYGKAVSPSIATMANNSYQRMMNLNSGNYVEPVDIVIPAGHGGRYNINSDGYR